MRRKKGRRRGGKIVKTKKLRGEKIEGGVKQEENGG